MAFSSVRLVGSYQDPQRTLVSILSAMVLKKELHFSIASYRWSVTAEVKENVSGL